MAKKKLKQIAEEFDISFEKAQDLAFQNLEEEMITGKGKNTWGSNPAKSTTVTCFHCGEVGHYVADCPQKANGQPPQGKGADKGKTRKGSGKGGPKGYGPPGSDPRTCTNHAAGNCRFGADCIFQHIQ